MKNALLAIYISLCILFPFAVYGQNSSLWYFTNALKPVVSSWRVDLQNLRLTTTTNCSGLGTDAQGDVECSSGGGGGINSGSVISIGDDRYVRTAGDTMTGTLFFDPIGTSTAINARGIISGSSLAISGNGSVSGTVFLRSNQGLTWQGGSRLYEQSGTARMLYQPNGDRFEVLDEAGSNFLAGFHGGASTLANSIRLYKAVGIGNVSGYAISGTLPTNGLLVAGQTGLGLTAPETQLDVLGTISGSRLTISNNASVSGSIVTESGAYIAGTSLVVQANNGRVGIGTATPAQELTVNGGIQVGPTASTSPYIFPFFGSSYTVENTTGRGLTFYNYNTSHANTYGTVVTGETMTAALGFQNNFFFRRTFSPTSGTATFSNLEANTTINQTGGANGITRDLYFNPTLTAAADYRAIEVNLGSTNHYGIYQAGTNARNLFQGTISGAGLEITGVASGTNIFAAQSVTGSHVNAASTFGGAGLTNCTGAANKLTWLSATKQFACETDETGGGTGGGMSYATASGIFLKRSGGTLTGVLVIRPVSGTSTVGLNVAATYSGRALQVWGTGASTEPTIYTDVSTNRVGFGTSTPKAQFQVKGPSVTSFQIGGGANAVTLPTSYSMTGQEDGFRVESFRTGAGVKYNDIISNETGGFDPSNFRFFTVQSGGGSAEERMTITSDGRVGIGITHANSPETALDVLGTISGSRLSISGPSGISGSLTLGDANTALAGDLRILGSNTNNYARIYGAASTRTEVDLVGAASGIWNWSSDYSVGVNTTAPKARFDVVGTISGTSLIVSRNGSFSGSLRVVGTMSGSIIEAATISGTNLFATSSVTGTHINASSTFAGAGLSDCDNATTSKLLWNDETKTFSCGSDQSGGGGASASSGVIVLYTNTSDSNDISTGTSASDWNTSYTIPADQPKVGDVYEFETWGLVNGGTNTRRPNIGCNYGSTVLFTFNPFVAPNSSNAFKIKCRLHFRTVGASANIVASGILSAHNVAASSPLASTDIVEHLVSPTVATVNTTTSNAFKLTNFWNIDDGSGKSSLLRTVVITRNVPYETVLGGNTGWTDDGSTVRLTTSSDAVGVGTATVDSGVRMEILGTISGSTLIVSGNGSFSGALFVDSGSYLNGKLVITSTGTGQLNSTLANTADFSNSPFQMLNGRGNSVFRVYNDGRLGFGEKTTATGGGLFPMPLPATSKRTGYLTNLITTSTAPTAVGITTPTLSGSTGVANPQSAAMFIKYAAPNSAGPRVGGIYSNTVNDTTARWQPELSLHMMTGTGTANLRFFTGVTSNRAIAGRAHTTTPAASTIRSFGIGWEDGVASTNWLCCSSDNTNYSCKDMGVAVQTSREYVLESKLIDNGTKLICTVTGDTVTRVEKTDNLPSGVNAMGYWNGIVQKTVGANARAWLFGSFSLSQR